MLLASYTNGADSRMLIDRPRYVGVCGVPRMDYLLETSWSMYTAKISSEAVQINPWSSISVSIQKKCSGASPDVGGSYKERKKSRAFTERAVRRCGFNFSHCT
jgi:hypothetical protein